MDKITTQEEINEKKDKIVNLIDPILAAIDEIVPPTWTKNQVASVFSVFLEVYR